MSEMTWSHGAWLPFLLVVLVTTFSTVPGSKGFSIELIPRTSKESPLYNANLTVEERMQEAVEISRARIHQLGLKINPAAMPKAIQPPLVITTYNPVFYVIKLGFGKPVPADFYLMVDTGSSLTWVQSFSCTECFPIYGGSFDYRSSETFEAMDCDSIYCKLPKCGKSPYCVYNQAYGGGSTSSGVMATDYLAFRSSGDNVEYFGAVFGLGQRNRVNFGNDGPLNRIAGIFGLGTGEYSFVEQYDTTKDHSLSRFSYCLVSPWKTSKATYLKFGKDTKFPPNVEGQTTHFLNGPFPYYYLNCYDISVAGNSIGIDRNAFTRFGSSGEGGLIIDSGSPGTQLFKDVHDRLIDGLSFYFSPYFRMVPYKRTAGWTNCFARPKDFNKFPTITFHLDGANYMVGEDQGLFIGGDDYFCLTIESTTHPVSILGGFLQTNYRIRHDVYRKRLSFYPEVCG